MEKTDSQVAVRSFKREVESWRPFLDALRAEDREIARDLLETCWHYTEAIESSNKTYLVEPFFLTILLIQERRIRAREAELIELRERVDALWKQKAGS